MCDKDRQSITNMRERECDTLIQCISNTRVRQRQVVSETYLVSERERERESEVIERASERKNRRDRLLEAALDFVLLQSFRAVSLSKLQAGVESVRRRALLER